MEQAPATNDSDPVAAALERGYARAETRVKELDADPSLNPAQRHETLRQEAAVALRSIGEASMNMVQRWELKDTTGWEPETSADLNADPSIDDHEYDRRMSVLRTEAKATDDELTQELAKARPELLAHVETLAAHPWKDVVMPEPVDGYRLENREQVIAHLDEALGTTGLSTTTEHSEITRRWDQTHQQQEQVPQKERTRSVDEITTAVKKHRGVQTLDIQAPSKAAETARKLRAYQETTEQDHQQRSGMDNGPQRDRGPRHSL